MLTNPDMNKPFFTLFSPRFKDLVKDGKCPFCSQVIKEEEFPDELSKKEYSISGLCAKCQKSVTCKMKV
jgi:hypothetical protein